MASTHRDWACVRCIYRAVCLSLLVCLSVCPCRRLFCVLMLLSATGAVCHCHTEPTANAASPASRTGDADLPRRVTLWRIFRHCMVVEGKIKVNVDFLERLVVNTSLARSGIARVLRDTFIYSAIQNRKKRITVASRTLGK